MSFGVSTAAAAAGKTLSTFKTMGSPLAVGQPVYISQGSKKGDKEREAGCIYLVEPNNVFRNSLWGIVLSIDGTRAEVAYSGTVKVPSLLISGGFFVPDMPVYWNGTQYCHDSNDGSNLYVGTALNESELYVKTQLEHIVHIMRSIYAEDKSLEGISRLTELGIDYTTDMVNSMAMDSAKNTYVGGYFYDFQGVPGRNYLLKFDRYGNLDTEFMEKVVDNEKFNGHIFALAVDSRDNLYIGGSFTSYGVKGRSGLIKLTPSGDIDEQFVSTAVDGHKFNFGVSVISIDGNDNVYVGGMFSNYGGKYGRDFLVKLSPSGEVDESFMLNAVDGRKLDGFVTALAVDSTGSVYVGGTFTRYQSVIGRNFFLKLKPDGQVDSLFMCRAVDYRIRSYVDEIIVDHNDDVYVMGSFFSYGSHKLKNGGIVKLTSQGEVDPAFLK